MIGIYKVTNQQNGKIYIGKSKDIQRRWEEHRKDPFRKNSSAYNTLFYRAIRKYGIESFQFEVIEECTEDDLNEKEKYWIKHYNTYIRNPDSQGYNMSEGGEQVYDSKLYDINLIKLLWDEGKTPKEISNITKYDSNILYRYFNYLNIPVEERNRRAIHNREKSVECYDLSGKLVNIYPSVSAAVRALKSTIPNIDSGNICANCNHKITHIYGYIWKYQDDPISIDDLLKLSFHYNNREVNQYTLNGKYITTYKSLSEAAKQVGLSVVSGISSVCKGKQKTAGGYIWRYCNKLSENPYADLLLDKPLTYTNQYSYKQKL